MITGQVSEAEYVTAYQLHRSRTATIMNSCLAACIVIGTVMFITVSKKWGIPFITGGIGGLIGELVQSRWFIPRKVRGLYSQTKGRTDLTYSWDSENLSLCSSHGNENRPWSDFRKARENEQVFLLYTNNALFEIVSKKWFRDAEQVDEFRRKLKVVK